MKKSEISIIVVAIIVLIASIITLGFLSSPSHKKIAKDIRTADQWVTYCDSEPNIHQCLKAFDKIDFPTQCKIWDELTIMVANLRVDDVKGRNKCDAWGYLLIYSIDCKPYLNGDAFYEYIFSDKGKGQVAPRGRYIGFKSDRDLAYIVVGKTMGSTRIDELLNKYQAE